MNNEIDRKCRCEGCTAHICSVIDDCYVAQTKESAQTLEAELSVLRTQAVADAAEIDALKQQNAELSAVAQNVVDAHASTTHAIIAPSSEAFSRVVSDRQNQRDAAIYQLRQAIAKARGDL